MSVGAVTVWFFEEILASHSDGVITMAASHIVDPAGLFGEALAEVFPDLMRQLLQSVINAALG